MSGSKRDKLRATLESLNPLRQSPPMRDQDLFLLEYIRDRGLNASIVRNYNQMVEHIREFTSNLFSGNQPSSLASTAAQSFASSAMQGRTAGRSNSSTAETAGSRANVTASVRGHTLTTNATGKVYDIKVMTKVTVDGESRYWSKEQRHNVPYPYQFIKNKGMSISLVIVDMAETDRDDIVSIPFMVGSDWCRTSLDDHDPITAHQHGENVLDLRGYLLIKSEQGGCVPKYIFAHEKVAYNSIATVKNEKGQYITTLKTQDDKNNSVETTLYKKEGDGQEQVYYLKTSCLNREVKVNDLFDDLYEIITSLRLITALPKDLFMKNLMVAIAGEGLIDYIIYDYTSNDTSPFVLGTTKLSAKATELFREMNKRKEYYTNNFTPLYSDDTFKEFMLNAIFPSISPKDLTSKHSKYNAYVGKALLLMRMLISNILTEQEILVSTDRNNVGRKVYMTAAEIIRRDLTRDNGAFLRPYKESRNKVQYSMKVVARKGEINIVESFDMTNLFNSVAQLTSLNTPRSSYSKKIEPRDVNESHTGYVCPSETPSTEKVGLVTHMACTAAFSSFKYVTDVERKVRAVLPQDTDGMGGFAKLFHVTGSITIGSRTYTTEGQSIIGSNKKLLSINSNPYAMITEEQYELIRQSIKRDPTTMDAIVLRETIKVNDTDEVIVLAYNILCDSGRIHRPLYRVDKLIELGLLGDGMEALHKKHHDFNYFIEQGIVELVFPNEMEQSVICESRSKLKEEYDVLHPSRSAGSASNTPLNASKSPANASKSPANASKSPANASKSPANASKSPANALNSPANASDSQPNSQTNTPSNAARSALDPPRDVSKSPPSASRMRQSLANSPAQSSAAFSSIHGTAHSLPSPAQGMYRVTPVSQSGAAPAASSSMHNMTGAASSLTRGAAPAMNSERNTTGATRTTRTVRGAARSTGIDAPTSKTIAKQLGYTYCEIDPYAIYGMVSSCAPMFNHNPGNRAIHQSAMDKALLSKITSNENMLTETSAKKLHTTESCAVTTKTNEYYSRFLKNGVNAIMGINIGVHNQEDAIMLQSSFAKSIISERVIFHEFTLEGNEKAGIPDDPKAIDTYTKNRRYHAIDPIEGTPRLKAVLKEGDCIFTKYVVVKTPDPETGEEIEQYRMISLYVQTGKEGYVSKVSSTTVKKKATYQIILATMKTVELGDKVSSRYSQKSVVGGIVDDREMLYVDDPSSPLHGTKINALFSPLSITSRGTSGLLLEMMLGNLAVETGEVQDATSFTVSRERMIAVNERLMSLGYKPWCVERVFNPVTNTHMYTMVGVVHMRVLKHTAVDKQKACGMINHRYDLMNRQPPKGGPTGGSRLGYMDSNTLFGQNAAQLVNILYRDQSGKVVVNICTSCYHINDRCNRDSSTAVDIRAMDHCTRCDERTLREVIVPYSLVMIHNYLLPIGGKLDLVPN